MFYKTIKTEADNIPIKGVNLGGWLVLEKWITPSLFDHLNAQDETQYILELGDQAIPRLDKHRRSFVTERDFKWMKQCGVNAVRVPIGYWIFGDQKPYHGAIDRLDWVFVMADKYEMLVVIDLHAAPGGQNAWDHSGFYGLMKWHIGHSNIELTLEVIERLAKRYCSYKSLFGIELLNEPRWDMPHHVLVNYYTKSYERVRNHCSDRVAVIVSDAFRSTDWRDTFPNELFHNVILDTHLYQFFGEEDQSLNLADHLSKTLNDWEKLVSDNQNSLPVLIGEWSADLPPKALEGLSENQKFYALRSYASAQMLVFEKTSGWFYWTLKTESSSNWNFQQLVKNGILSIKSGG